MISKKELSTIANARIADAKVLYDAKRYDGAVYLCGYAVEMALKTTICNTLKWTGFPATKAEFNRLRSFRTHDLDDLLHLTAAETEIKTKHLAEWSDIQGWNPEVRYRPIGTASQKAAENMLDSARILTAALL